MDKKMDPVIPEKTCFSISEVSELAGVKPYVLRYWESEFKMLRPARRTSGQRKYTHKDIELILRVKELLYGQRYTIEGTKKVLRGESKPEPEQLTFELEDNLAALEFLKEIKNTLKEMLNIINK